MEAYLLMITIHLIIEKENIYYENLILIKMYLEASKYLNRGSYMSAHVLLNLLNELGEKEIKCESCRAFYFFFFQRV